jgi:hypothetical protein
VFRLTVQDVFAIRGRGLVATGRVESGQVRVGDEVQINGGRRVRVDGIERFRKVLDEAVAGEPSVRQDDPQGQGVMAQGGATIPPLETRLLRPHQSRTDGSTVFSTGREFTPKHRLRGIFEDKLTQT